MGKPSTNDIDIGNSLIGNNNDNVKRRRTPAEIARADQIADYVCRKMNNYGAREFYCKAAYALSEDQIYSCVETALRKGRDPVLLLSWLLSNELRRTNANRS